MGKLGGRGGFGGLVVWFGAFGQERSADEVFVPSDGSIGNKGRSFGRLSISLKVDDRSVQGHLPNQNAWQLCTSACSRTFLDLIFTGAVILPGRSNCEEGGGYCSHVNLLVELTSKPRDL